MGAPRIAIAPEPAADWVRQAIEEGGGDVVPLAESEGLVWTAPRGADELRSLLGSGPRIRWVQLPWAGVEEFARLGVFDDDGSGRQWTCGKGVYAEPVAEHALALALAGLRSLPERVRATSWGAQAGVSLYDARVTILGAGGITECLVDLLRPMRTEVTVVRRDASTPFPGALRTVGLADLHDALPGADIVFLALALTPGTVGVIGSGELARMEPHAWLVNVARGRHVDTHALVAALRNGVIGGAGLDVTEPEPLPDDHPLWALPNVIITPHTANTQEMARPLLGARITENVRRFAAGEELIGPVDGSLGY
ncbi:MAG TPA: D-isomer specific 2-hydroxyacid dehydrogenase family protein [Acidimicrobiales bacterium]|nr:D-isomer specific 2-hydroxyacid dehydrogenase family protein [Acidimicrobiales bacterium]